MEFNEFVRKPFIVEAMEITKENIVEVAKYIGDIEENEDGSRFIKVDSNLVPNVTRVYPGFYMTRMGDYIRCYSRRVFFEQFTPLTGDIQKWVSFLEKTTPIPRGF
jgi:hypothetical protein